MNRIATTLGLALLLAASWTLGACSDDDSGNGQ